MGSDEHRGTSAYQAIVQTIDAEEDSSLISGYGRWIIVTTAEDHGAVPVAAYQLPPEAVPATVLEANGWEHGPDHQITDDIPGEYRVPIYPDSWPTILHRAADDLLAAKRTWDERLQARRTLAASARHQGLPVTTIAKSLGTTGSLVYQLLETDKTRR